MLHPGFFRCLLAALLFVFWTAPAWAIGTTQPSWTPRETVTSTLANFLYMLGADRSLAYDHHGNPGIAFYDDVDGDLRYARRVPGIGWVHAAIDTLGNVGQYPSLAYDRYERPAMSYADFTNGDLKYARFTGSTWQLETVDVTGSFAGQTSLAFDLLGRPAIAYRDRLNSSLKYVHDTDGDFSLVDETPVTISFGSYTPSLVFDPWNRPMIAHLGIINEADVLRFSVQEPGIGWTTTTLDNMGSIGFGHDYPSIAIDPDTGFPAIAYPDEFYNLRFAAWDGHAWNRTTLDSFGVYPSLAYDPADGNPAIAYFDQANFDLKFAWHDGSIWQTQTLDTVDVVDHIPLDVGLTPSLAFNDYGSGFPSIAYFNNGYGGGNGSLFFIDDPPGAAVPEPASAILLAIGLALGFGCRKRPYRVEPRRHDEE